MKSLGFIETSGVTDAVTALDDLCKTADVHLVSWERKMGGRLVTLIVEGEVSAVSQAVETASTNLKKRGRLCVNAVIARPHEEVVKIVNISAKRMKNSEV
jgi:microcompartment protein CcmL/EutN